MVCCLCDSSRGLSEGVLPGGGKLVSRSVVSGETVDLGLAQTEAELAVVVVVVLVEVLVHGHSLLHQVIEVLRDLGGKTCTQTTRPKTFHARCPITSHRTSRKANQISKRISTDVSVAELVYCFSYHHSVVYSPHVIHIHAHIHIHQPKAHHTTA